MKKYDNVVSTVLKGSIGEEVGIEIGDILVSINDREIVDIIDYLFLLSDEYLEVEIQKKNGEIWILEIEKEYDEDLGIEFSSPILDCAMSCKNKCIFCFIDQMPKGMRKSLYFKDDDSRLSFLQGNFVTLTNLTEGDMDRIIEYNISPINVSIHTTNPELRKSMLNNKFAGNINERLKKLVNNRIEINGQIVLCPGFNDGEELVKTVKECFDLGGSFNSLAVVPIGLTKYRENLTFIPEVSMEIALETIKNIHKLQKYFLEKRGTRFVFLSDEIYLKAKVDLPKASDYEEFSQIENGIGLIRKLEIEIMESLNKVDKKQVKGGSFSIATGVLPKDFIRRMANEIEKKFENIKINVFSITNNFFGHKITVAGLVTGSDLIKQLNEVNLGSKLLLPKVMFKSDEFIFLDDMTLEELENKLNIKVQVVDNNGEEFINKILF